MKIPGADPSVDPSQAFQDSGDPEADACTEVDESELGEFLLETFEELAPDDDESEFISV